MAQERPFKEIHVANFSEQQRRDRYPDPYGRYEYSNASNILSFTGMGHEEREDEGEPPRIAIWRSNLVALSQHFNLYFAAYQDRIHCYIPRDLKQTIPSRADLILDLPQSDRAKTLGGYINPIRPHCVNHMIVGNLGDFEILLMACDDGDVIAYYTHLLLDELKALGVGAKATISKNKPFFHQNVVRSAWGLAIHQQSRLIAVSSNLRDVTIFAHGYTGNAWPSEYHANQSSEEFPLAKDLSHPPKGFDDRLCNFRLSLNLGAHGDNIPTIDFTSHPNGKAKYVLAADIKGNLWILDAWKATATGIAGIPHSPDTQASRRAWGVLLLPFQNFKLTATPHEALGISDMKLYTRDESVSQYFDISNSVHDVRDNSPWHPGYGFGVNGSGTRRTGRSVVDHVLELSLETDNDEDERMIDWCDDNDGTHSIDDHSPRRKADHGFLVQMRALLAMEGNRHGVQSNEWVDRLEKLYQKRPQPSADDLNDLKEEAMRAKQEQTELFRLLLRLPPSMRKSIRSWIDLDDRYHKLKTLDQKGIIPMISTGEETYEQFVRFPDPVAILRSYSHDIELLSPLNPSRFNTILRNPHKQHIHDELNRLEDFDRLNLLASIPELNLVIVGSQIGRVSLLTLTKFEDRFSRVGPVLMFRLDLILPLKHHEDESRPECPLLGMAVSPLQKSSTCSGVRGKWKRRWRLILHYYDHTILSYELGREDEGDGLKVF